MFHLPLLMNAGRPNCPLVFGLRLLQAYDRRSLSAHQFRQQIFGLTVKFGNDPVGKDLGYRCTYRLGKYDNTRVYYVEGLGHNLFSVGQFCDSNLEVAFRQHTCFIHNLEGVDLLTGSRGNNLYTLSLRDMMASSPICLLSKASKTKSWLWHRRLSHLNFGAINHLARTQSCLRSPRVLIMKRTICVLDAQWDPTKLKVPVRRIRTDNGTGFVNQMLREYYEKVGISHEISVARSPQQNGVVERQNRTLIEAARTMNIDERLRWLLNIAMSWTPHVHEMTPATISSGLMPNPPPSTMFVPPLRTDWDMLFQLLFDELLNPPPSVDHPAPEFVALIDEVAAPEPAISTGSPSSTTVDQDAPSPTFAAHAEHGRTTKMDCEDYFAFLNVDTPLIEKSKLDKDKEGKAIDLSHYRGMIGTLLYLIARTVNRGLWYPKDSSIALTAFADADQYWLSRYTPDAEFTPEDSETIADEVDE
ncbi:retrovirus-related pol polyprotein from transposon TNT 1-94 [Tanacetum coccineum]